MENCQGLSLGRRDIEPWREAGRSRLVAGAATAGGSRERQGSCTGLGYFVGFVSKRGILGLVEGGRRRIEEGWPVGSGQGEHGRGSHRPDEAVWGILGEASRTVCKGEQGLERTLSAGPCGRGVWRRGYETLGMGLPSGRVLEGKRNSGLGVTCRGSFYRRYGFARGAAEIGVPQTHRSGKQAPWGQEGGGLSRPRTGCAAGVAAWALSDFEA